MGPAYVGYCTMVEEQKRGERFQWVFSERALLTAVLVCQAAILFALYRRPPAGPVSGPAVVPAVAVRRPAPAQRQVRSGGVSVPARSTRVWVGRDPWSQAQRMEAEMRRFISEAFGGIDRAGASRHRDSAWDRLTASPGMDMRECKDEYVVQISLPGLDEEQLAVTLEGRLLTILAPTSRSGAYRRPTAVLQRKVRLPGPVGDARRAQAGLTNGILRVVVPKSEYFPSADGRVWLLGSDGEAVVSDR